MQILIDSFVHAFLAGILPALYLWAGILLALAAVVLLLRGQAPRVPIAVASVAAVCLAAGAAAPALS